MGIIFNRVWEMPNSKTFDIKCINNLIQKYIKPEHYSIDPFAVNMQTTQASFCGNLKKRNSKSC